MSYSTETWTGRWRQGAPAALCVTPPRHGLVGDDKVLLLSCVLLLRDMVWSVATRCSCCPVCYSSETWSGQWRQGAPAVLCVTPPRHGPVSGDKVLLLSSVLLRRDMDRSVATRCSCCPVCYSTETWTGGLLNIDWLHSWKKSLDSLLFRNSAENRQYYEII